MRVCLAIPCTESVPGAAFGWHLNAAVEMARYPVEVCIVTPTGMVPHDRARACALATAREKRCSRIFWIDADTIVPPGAFARMMQTMDSTGARLVVGRYVMRGWPFVCVWSRSGYRCDAESGTHELDAAGLGCALLDLDWLDANTTGPYFTMDRDKDGITMVTDDLSLCRVIRSAGGVILGVADIVCGHVFNQVVSPQNAQHLRLAHLGGDNHGDTRNEPGLRPGAQDLEPHHEAAGNPTNGDSRRADCPARP